MADGGLSLKVIGNGMQAAALPKTSEFLEACLQMIDDGDSQLFIIKYIKNQYLIFNQVLEFRLLLQRCCLSIEKTARNDTKICSGSHEHEYRLDRASR